MLIASVCHRAAPLGEGEELGCGGAARAGTAPPDDIAGEAGAKATGVYIAKCGAMCDQCMPISVEMLLVAKWGRLRQTRTRQLTHLLLSHPLVPNMPALTADPATISCAPPLCTYMLPPFSKGGVDIDK
jgi:hypothetical protein